MIPIEVKRPVLLDANLQPVRVLNAEDVDLAFNSPGISQATIRLPHDEPEPALHSFVEVFYIDGSAGVFRVSVPSQDYVRQQSIVLRHGIDTLADSVYKAQLDFEGTVAQLLSNLLSYQTTKVGGVACWQLGTCEDNATVKYSINYNRLSDLLAQIEEDQEGYYFEYDQSSFPWTLHFRARPATVGTQFRRGRNIRTISRTLNDNDLCTQLILSVNVATTVTSDTGDATSTDTVIRTYDNAAAQAIWGVIQRTADIDTNDNITAGTFTEADAWAQKFLADHATPTVQMQIDGDEYFAQTGDTLDRARLNYLCAVPLPEYGQDFEQRIVSVHYPNALSDPRHVTASLATQLPKFSTSIRSLQKQTAANARASRSIARSAAKAKEMTHWSMVVTDQQLALDGTGILQLYESGIDMDAQGGVVIYNLAQGLQSLYSGIEAQAGRIDLVVQGEGSSASIKISAIVDGINNAGSSIIIDADHIDINGLVTKLETMAIAVGSLHVEGRSDFLRDIYAEDYIHTDEYVSAANGFYGSGFYIGTYGMNPVDVSGAIASVAEDQNPPYGKVGFTYTKLNGTPGTVNFNIAATSFFLNSVAAAQTISTNTAITIDVSELGTTVTKNLTVGNGYDATTKQLPFNITLPAGGGSHNITIMASTRESANPGGYTEIFEDAGAYTDLRNKVDGFYTFKVSCGGTDKWYGFWVGPRG